MTKPTIGFIGLGLMGAAMISRLQDLNYPLVVLANRSRANVDLAVSRGASEVSSARELASKSEIIMLCMDTSANVESRMRGADGVIAGLRPNAMIIDFGTSLPASTIALGKEVEQAGGTLLDAPLGRTPAHAYEGKLNIMAAGDEAAFQQVSSTLHDLGENVFHLGALGTGHKIKLLNNFFGMSVANAMAEAFAMASTLDVERETLYKVVSAGPLHSSMMDFVKAYAVEGDASKLAFAIKNATKDLGYYAQMAQDAGVESVVAPNILSAMVEACAAGQADEMVSQMVDYYAQQFKTEKT